MTEHSDHNERQQTQIADDTAPTVDQYIVKYSYAAVGDLVISAADENTAWNLAIDEIRRLHPNAHDRWIDEVRRG